MVITVREEDEAVGRVGDRLTYVNGVPRSCYIIFQLHKFWSKREDILI